MGSAAKGVRQSISLPARLAKRVCAIAKARRTSANRVLVDLIETGLEARDAEKERFLASPAALEEPLLRTLGLGWKQVRLYQLDLAVRRQPVQKALLVKESIAP
jgi:hypothetical protein